jgi:hypothetical protein
VLDLAVRNQQRKNARPSGSLENAAQRAQSASGALGEGELDEAAEQEQEVQRELDRALGDLAQEEEQYQRLRQEELLFRIAEEVANLAKGETEALAAVREIDAGREPHALPSRPDRLRLRRISQDEAALSARAREIAADIESEQSFVFAQALREIGSDLERAARDLGETGDYETGERVQAVMEDALEVTGWVLESLKNEQRNREQQARQQRGGEQQSERKNRLVPDVAELKLLRRLEVETLEGLRALVALHPELESGAAEPDLAEDVLRLAERHERTSQLFEQFRARLGIPDPGAQPSADGAPPPAPPPTPPKERPR